MAKSKNFMEMKPKRDGNIEWNEGEKVVLKIKRDGKLDKIMNKIFKTPIVTNLELDEIGSYVWENCDGEKNVYEISIGLKNHFGNRVEPAIDRLVQYIKILKNNSLIELE